MTFVPFFLNQSHVPEGGVPAWDDPAQQADLLALAAGVVVRDRFPEQFLAVHRALFAARHDEGGDLRDRARGRRRPGRGRCRRRRRTGRGRRRLAGQADPGRARGRGVTGSRCSGCRPSSSATSAVFVRLMARPDGDADLARATVERVLGLITDHPELNEFKHTRLAR